jgi:fatty-acyl-CoA synthase
MLGLMQAHPLNIPTILRHAERLHARKTVTTRTDAGLVTATFGQVIERARRLMAALHALGVNPDDRVATFSWNTQQHLEAYLAVPCIGAILHTLNIRLFAEDLAYIVEHAQDRVVIVDKSLWPAWAKVAAKVGCVSKTIVVDDAAGPLPPGTLEYEALLRAHDPLADWPQIPEDQAAALCYTSGTTGHPKGVLYSHRSNVLHSLVVATPDVLGLSERDVVLPIVPMFHANAWGLPYACVLFGASLVMPGKFMAPGPLLELLVEKKVTYACGVPSIWLGLLEPMKKARDRLGSLKRLACGGSAIPPALLRAFREDLGLPVYHAWGMTETSPLGSVARPLAEHDGLSEEELDAIRTTQGRPVPLVELRLADDQERDVPWDGKSVGEIQVRGPWIASAYFGCDASDKFAGGWLHTGDVASIDEQGYIRITDRTKDLVKSGGEWISSVALEGLIMGHPGVSEAAVIAVSHPKWCERPLACVVTRPEAKGRLSREELLDWLRPRVAKWWLPDDVVFIDEVPKTSVGKFDKKVLRERFKNHALPTE